MVQLILIVLAVALAFAPFVVVVHRHPLAAVVEGRAEPTELPHDDPPVVLEMIASSA